MPGWIIQGVRGEGKSLAAVGKIREYMLQGRPVATNLDLFLENLLPAENETLAYRLPDHPRLEDFELLPPAYDPKYKGEDKNGLLVLDELGTWLNSRSWNDKGRLKMLNWLFLSRKNHWDLILLAQDNEMIDAQVRSTLCDYLVQASRMDRQKIPFLAPMLDFLGINSFMPKVHVYHVFYGMSTNQKPVEKWQFTGKKLYDGYDTNQRFRDGMEALGGTLVDMRATYSYLPVNYLTKNVFVQRLQNQIAELKKKPEKAVDEMAVKRTTGTDAKQKAYVFLFFLAGFLIWRFSSGGFLKKPEITPLPTASAVVSPAPAVPVSSVPSLIPDSLAGAVDKPNSVNGQSSPVSSVLPPANFLTTLMKAYKPRLASYAYVEGEGFYGSIDFYNGTSKVETFDIKELHALGASLVKRPYGADLYYSDSVVVVTAWDLQDQKNEPKKPV